MNATLEDSIQRLERLIEETKNDYHSKCPLSRNNSLLQQTNGSASSTKGTPRKHSASKSKQELINERIRSNILAEDESQDQANVGRNRLQQSFYIDSEPFSSAESLGSKEDEADCQLRSNGASFTPCNKTIFETPATSVNSNSRDQTCSNCGAVAGIGMVDGVQTSAGSLFDSLKGRTDLSLHKLSAIDDITTTMDEKLELYRILVRNLLLERDACVELVLEQSEKIVSYEQKVQKFENLIEMEDKYNQCLKTVQELENKLHVYELRENIYRQSFCNRKDRESSLESGEGANILPNQSVSSISTNQMLQIVQQLQKVISEQGSEIQKLRSTFCTFT